MNALWAGLLVTSCAAGLCQVTNQVSHAPVALQKGTNTAPAALKPGVYLSVPYSCLIVVPPGHLDERMIVGPRGTNPAMPIVRPELKLIPWRGKKP